MSSCRSEGAIVHLRMVVHWQCSRTRRGDKVPVKGHSSKKEPWWEKVELWIALYCFTLSFVASRLSFCASYIVLLSGLHPGEDLWIPHILNPDLGLSRVLCMFSAISILFTSRGASWMWRRLRCGIVPGRDKVPTILSCQAWTGPVTELWPIDSNSVSRHWISV